MLFRQLLDKQTSTYTYLLADKETKEALLIDPVLEQMPRDLQLLDELGLKLKFVVETHVHADHVTSAARLRERTGALVATSLAGKVETADLHLENGDALTVGKVVLEARSTPGHTASCMSFVTADETMVFTGDTLFIRGCGRTDFQEGDAKTLYRSVHDQIFSLPDEAFIYPGHDYKGRTRSTVGEEKALNPRLKLANSEADFVGIMNGLDLAYPQKIDVALPANLLSGGVDAPASRPVARDAEDAIDDLFAASVRSSTGVPEIDTKWMSAYGDRVRVVDVRQPEELLGDLGAITGAKNVPLAVVGEVAQTWDRAAPLLVFCRSGGRSGRAALILERMGFSHVVSMSGGLMKWVEEGRKTEMPAMVA